MWILCLAEDSHEISSSSSDFWLTCRYRGHIHNSGPPSRQLACCTHGRSHTRSPGVSIMRVDSWELPLSAIPLCQLLPSHLGPPRPTLSITLYVKGCLDCTVGAFHMSIPAEPSLFQYEVQVFNSLKYQVLFSLKNHEKYSWQSSAAFVIGTKRVKSWSLFERAEASKWHNHV